MTDAVKPYAVEIFETRILAVTRHSWRLRAPNGRLIAKCAATFPRPADAHRSADKFIQAAGDGRIRKDVSQ